MGGGHSTSTSSSKTLKFAGHTSEGKANAKVGVVTRSFDEDKIGLRTHGCTKNGLDNDPEVRHVLPFRDRPAAARQPQGARGP